MAVCPQCRAVHGDDVETCPEHGPALLPAGSLPPADDGLEPGTMVGEYRIDRRLGAGTFGEVYAGEHPLIGKKVAVKVLNRRFAWDPQMVSRFVAEARAVNKIRQRNIIDIFAFGVIEGRQRHYFVMELCDGMTLGDLMAREGRIAIPTVLSIVRGVADALDAAHEAGVTHRDLKPDNVFLARERDGSFFPKLLDFGIAKLLGDDVAHKTGSGVVLGTPRYMSPEQARGRPADHLSDVYALGVMIHEMITGAQLFAGESSVDVLLKHTAEPPPPMSSLCPDLPAALDAPVLAMLAKRPRARPRSAGEAVAALTACARDLGLDGAAPSPSAKGAHRPAAESVPTVARARKAATTLSERRAAASDPAGEPITGETPAPASRDVVSTPSAGPPSTEALAAVETTGRRWDSGPRSSAPPETARDHAGAGARVRTVAVALVGLAALASAFAFGRSWAQPREAPPGLAAPAPQPTATTATAAAEPEVTVASPAPLPGTVDLRLSTRPPDVEVWIGDRKLGSSGEAVAVPRGKDRVALTLRKPGFKDETLELTPDHDQSIDASLTPVAPPARKDAQPAARPAASLDRMERVFGTRD